MLFCNPGSGIGQFPGIEGPQWHRDYAEMALRLSGTRWPYIGDITQWGSWSLTKDVTRRDGSLNPNVIFSRRAHFIAEAGILLCASERSAICDGLYRRKAHRDCEAIWGFWPFVSAHTGDYCSIFTRPSIYIGALAGAAI